MGFFVFTVDGYLYDLVFIYPVFLYILYFRLFLIRVAMPPPIVLPGLFITILVYPSMLNVILPVSLVSFKVIISGFSSTINALRSFTFLLSPFIFRCRILMIFYVICCTAVFFCFGKVLCR